MKTKLNLTIDKSVIKLAQSYAKKTGRSLSEIIENYPIFITKESSTSDLSPKLSKIVGAVQLPEDYDEVYERRSFHQQKHIE